MTLIYKATFSPILYPKLGMHPSGFHELNHICMVCDLLVGEVLIVLILGSIPCDGTMFWTVMINMYFLLNKYISAYDA